MKCLRVYSTADGESHFDEVEIPTTSRQVHPNAAAFEVSARYAASCIRFTHIPAGGRLRTWLARDTNRSIRPKNRLCSGLVCLRVLSTLAAECQNRRSSLARLYDRS